MLEKPTAKQSPPLNKSTSVLTPTEESEMLKAALQLQQEAFVSRHLGPQSADISKMLSVLKLKTLDDLVSKTIPQGIRLISELKLEGPKSEDVVLQELKEIAAENKVYRSLIGLG